MIHTIEELFAGENLRGLNAKLPPGAVPYYDQDIIKKMN